MDEYSYLSFLQRPGNFDMVEYLQHQQQKQKMSKYAQLLAVIEEMGTDLRPTYSGSKSSTERLKRSIVHARILVRECLMEAEMQNQNGGGGGQPQQHQHQHPQQQQQQNNSGGGGGRGGQMRE